MLQLWKAVTHLGRQPDLLDACVAAAALRETQNPDPNRRQQPAPEAIAALDGLLNKQAGLRLGLYELAEVNRMAATPGFKAAMEAWAAAVDLHVSGGESFDEAAGVLLFDREFRKEIAAHPDPAAALQGQGFRVAADEAGHLQQRLAQGSAGAAAAEQFFNLLWTGSSCLQRLALYSRYVHPNY